ncbi:MAG: hypothetical protein QMD46_09495 [Methanomicrobiales archaeon]|nr:hypothetical protein [Methanomicrobiales archaeon]MDI6877246.1 hypothetical protein [Methanomicrobiales archaeon]
MVTIWDTYEYFVYDYRHLTSKQKIYRKITGMDIQVRGRITERGVPLRRLRNQEGLAVETGFCSPDALFALEREGNCSPASPEAIPGYSPFVSYIER